MANVQPEHGFTKVANEILEHMALIKLSPIQYRIIFVIWRYTYGFNRKEHKFSSSFISKATNYDERQVRRELQKLESKKIIFQKVSKGRPRSISFNKNYDEWIGDIETPGKTTPGKVTLTTPGKVTPQERNNINKNINKCSSSSSEDKIYEFYHHNLQVGLTSSPFVYEQIEHWIKDMSPELVLAAMKLAAKKEKRGFDYTEGILKKWVEAKVQTIEDARKFETSFKQFGRGSPKTKKRFSKEDFDLSE